MPGFATTLAGEGLDIEGYAGVQLVTSASAAQTAVLNEGAYDVWASQDTYIKIGPTANDVTTATGYLIRTNNTVPIVVRQGSRIGAIAAGAGTLTYHRTA